MKHLWRDIGFGCRTFLRNPGFTVAALLSLILGIGCNTAVFSLLDAVFERPLPVEDLDSLAAVYMSRRNDEGEYVARLAHSYLNYRDLRDQNRSFSGLATSFWWQMSLTGGTEPVRAAGMFVSHNYFDVLGLEPALGRFFLPEEDAVPGAHPVAVLSHSCWRRLFGSRTDVLGETIEVNGHDLTVVGVGPRGFHGTDITADISFWMPSMMFPLVSRFGQYFEARGGAIFHIFGRLREGVTRSEAEAEATRFYEDIEAAYAADFVGFEGVVAVVRPLSEGAFQGPAPQALREQYQRYGQWLEVVVWVLLSIACLSVANLLLVRGFERARELAIRKSLGAGRWRLFRQLATENLTLFLLGGVLALPAGWWLMRFLWRFRPPLIAPGDEQEIRLHLGVFLFTFAVALGTGLVFGVLPALRASRADMVTHLKESGAVVAGSRLDLRRVLVVVQVALALVALIGAGLFLTSLRNVYDLDLGFDADQLVAVSFAPAEQGEGSEKSEQLFRRVLEEARAIPGVQSATLSENRLLRGAVVRHQVFLPGGDEPVASAESDFHRANAVTPGFFETSGITLLQGRDFDDSIAEDGPPVVIINQTMAETLWPGKSAVGERIKLDFPDAPEVEVLGVAEDAKYRGIVEPRQFFLYLPMKQVAPPQATLHARTEGDPAALLGTLRKKLHEIDPTLPLADVHPMSWFVDEDLWEQRATARLLTAFGLLALALATLGVYGVLAQGITQRRREIGIRLAVGARRSDLLRWVLADGATVIGLGIAAGLASALLVSALLPAISAKLIDVDVIEPVTYLGAAAVLAAVAFLGCLIPARRAATVDPVRSLREE